MENTSTATARSSLQIETIAKDLPAGFETLRGEALAEGRGFIERLATGWHSGAARFDHAGEALLAATVDGELAGVGGITIEPVVPNALRMRRFYVRPSHRRGGVGRELAMTLLHIASRSHRLITVNAAPDSVPFWVALGFHPDARDGHTHILTTSVARLLT